MINIVLDAWHETKGEYYATHYANHLVHHII